VYWDIRNDQLRQRRHRFVSSCGAHHRVRIYWRNRVGLEWAVEGEGGGVAARLTYRILSFNSCYYMLRS
jgi:hypothetical protein